MTLTCRSMAACSRSSCSMAAAYSGGKGLFIHVCALICATLMRFVSSSSNMRLSRSMHSDDSMVQSCAGMDDTAEKLFVPTVYIWRLLYMAMHAARSYCLSAVQSWDSTEPHARWWWQLLTRTCAMMGLSHHLWLFCCLHTCSLTSSRLVALLISMPSKGKRPAPNTHSTAQYLIHGSVTVLSHICRSVHITKDLAQCMPFTISSDWQQWRTAPGLLLLLETPKAVCVQCPAKTLMRAASFRARCGWLAYAPINMTHSNTPLAHTSAFVPSYSAFLFWDLGPRS